MSKSEASTAKPAKRAAALQYRPGDGAPVIVASGMGHLAEKIVEVAGDNGVPVYEDTSLATVLTQMELGREIPEELYQAVVDIYVYFLNFDPKDPEKFRRERNLRVWRKFLCGKRFLFRKLRRRHFLRKQSGRERQFIWKHFCGRVGYIQCFEI